MVGKQQIGLTREVNRGMIWATGTERVCGRSYMWSRSGCSGLRESVRLRWFCGFGYKGEIRNAGRGSEGREKIGRRWVFLAVRLLLLVFRLTDADSCLLAFVYNSGVHNDRKRTRVTCSYTRRHFGLTGKRHVCTSCKLRLGWDKMRRRRNRRRKKDQEEGNKEEVGVCRL